MYPGDGNWVIVPLACSVDEVVLISLTEQIQDLPIKYTNRNVWKNKYIYNTSTKLGTHMEVLSSQEYSKYKKKQFSLGRLDEGRPAWACDDNADDDDYDVV